MKTETTNTIKRYKNTDYYVTSDGRVFSKKNYRGTNLKELKPQTTSNGYQEISFYVNGEKVKHYVHRLVLELYSDIPMEQVELNKLEACHLDDNVKNNHINNLKWGSRSYNMKQIDKTWKRNKPRYKDSLKNHILKLNESGVSMKTLSETHGISYTSVYRWCNPAVTY